MELSVDFGLMFASLDRPVDPARLGATLLVALADNYESVHGDCALYEFEQSGAVYLFDLASGSGLPQEDRTVAAWTITPGSICRRDATYQRGFPMAPGTANATVDRGHLIPHLSGGEFGPNIFRQDRALNRGWSEAASALGAFYPGHSPTPTPRTIRRRSRSAFFVRIRCTLRGSTTVPLSDEPLSEVHGYLSPSSTGREQPVPGHRFRRSSAMHIAI